MSNDRLYLVCKECDSQILLYKYYPNAGYIYHEDDKLIDWLDRHCLEVGGCECIEVVDEHVLCTRHNNTFSREKKDET